MTQAHYPLSIDGVTCCADGTLYDDGAPATWRTVTAARSALKSVKARRRLTNQQVPTLAVHACHCNRSIAMGLRASISS